jgi:aryl-alcohol dehydrogenase-like predicted oxidoreductase
MAMTNDNGTFAIGGDLEVHRLGYGAMRVTGEGIIGPPDDEDHARAVLRRVRELGVDFIDTADSYGPGVSERLLREALAPYEDVVVATKAGLVRNTDTDWKPHGHPEYVHNQALVCRDRLGVEAIDLFQFHRPDPEVPFEDSVHAFAELKDEGLVRHVGLSNVSVEQLETAHDIVEVATVQNRYNVGFRESEDVLEACESHDIGFIPWFPVGAGELDEALDAVAERRDATPYQVALAWLLAHSPVTLPIPGTASLEHLEENVAASSLELTDEDMSDLEQLA